MLAFQIRSLAVHSYHGSAGQERYMCFASLGDNSRQHRLRLCPEVYEGAFHPAAHRVVVVGERHVREHERL
jgi:hypothetical protein